MILAYAFLSSFMPFKEDKGRGTVKMVSEEGRGSGKVYVCERCGFAYKEKTWTEKCEEYCVKHNACSLEIINHAVKDS